jgi:hypothetical protein
VSKASFRNGSCTTATCICLGLASVVFWAAEAKKLVERRLRKRP